MEVTVGHQLGPEEVRRRLEAGLETLLCRFGDSVSNINRNQEGDTTRFSCLTQGQNITGFMTLADQQVVLNLDLPWAAKFFEDVIREAIEANLAQILNVDNS